MTKTLFMSIERKKKDHLQVFSIYLHSVTEITEASLMDISDHLGNQWRTVGVYLGLSWKLLDQIKMCNRDNQLQAGYSMLLEWQRSSVGQAGRSQLRCALQEAGLVGERYNKVLLMEYCV